MAECQCSSVFKYVLVLLSARIWFSPCERQLQCVAVSGSWPLRRRGHD